MILGNTAKTVFTLCAGLVAATGGPALAQSTASDDAPEPGKISILDAAPPVYYGLKRMPKFYSDPNMDRATLDGSLSERQYLLGSVGGARDAAAEAGLVFDAGVTQVVQGTVAGDGDGARYYGSADLWGVLDTGRAGLWSGGLIIGHFEGNWGEVVEGTGALLPLNGDAIMPAAPSGLALSELYAVQGLPAGLSALIGKANFAGLADKSFFANDERNQFLYEGLINDPILGSFIPYTTLGGALNKQFGEDVVLSFVLASNDTNSQVPGFDDFGFDTITYGLAATWNPTFAGLPGSYNALAGYTTKSALNFDVDPRYLIGEIIGLVPVSREGENYAVTAGGSQYLWVDQHAKRSDGLPVGLGLFARFGWAPKDRNVIDQFYSVGIGGTGGPFGRTNDGWGIGWAGTHFSSDLRRDAGVLGFSLNSFEHAVEGYYNVAITPAVKTSFHLQYIDSANPARDEALVLGARLQLDF